MALRHVPALPLRFYQRPAEAVARDLLGKVLVQDDGGGGPRRQARIVETEAYIGPHDLASHSARGRTLRNAAMWGPPGHAYVFLVYGMHHCLNVVTGPGRGGHGQAVLLRAAEPLDGWASRLSGPGLLARGFGVTRAHDNADLRRGPLRILDGPPPARVAKTPRIGVDYAKEWAYAPLRFIDADSPHVSQRGAFKSLRSGGVP
jgi:DNA-3-methyladenine glycosylase